MYKQISIQQLQPGMVIVRITEQNGPVKIRKSGLVTSPEMVQGLAEMGVLALEIDPQQTVELDASTVETKLSATQQLLSQQGKEQQQLEHNLSDQFNRSLFLPSVQDIPSVWQHYLRQFLTSLMVSVVGLVVGFTVAKVPLWLDSQVQLVQKTAPDLPEQTTETQVEPIPQVAEVVASVQENRVEAQPDPPPVRQEIVSTHEVPATRLVPPEPEVKQDLSAISPELLQKFQQAVEDIQPDSPANTGDTEPLAVEHEEVLRVDQLPAWLLTELPSMSFSAHMYASEPHQRWVRVNGIELGEGEWLQDNLRINRIEAQRVIMNYRGHEFSMGALTDW